MLDYESTIICERFIQCLSRLKADGKITGITSFCERYHINRRNMAKLKNDTSRQIFKPSWMYYLVRDYGISADYLLTGRGQVYAVSDAKRAKNVQAIQDLLVTLL